MDKQTGSGVSLSETDQTRLVRAIEGAIEVRHASHFQAWLRGPFRSLLPHDCVVCIEIDASGATHHIESLYHGPCASDRVQLFCDPEEGLAVRLVRLVATSAAGFSIADGPALRGMLGSGADNLIGISGGAVVYRTAFVSGGACFFVLFGVLAEFEQHCVHLLKLMSSHLKMAWSQVAVRPAVIRAATSITAREQEILRWMRRGKSNQEISVLLAISPLTLKNHIRKIYRKLDVQNREEAISRGLGTPLAVADTDAVRDPVPVGDALRG